ncbi:helix-turn-helix protein [Flavobacterium araucananum]|uniref:HTH araC/xylS-type domain-containing protein n=1 Tax=Flavobacterium araucananum TaxID=946678 RepID=A0A227P528_9FLAO|nr:helix-turn-helix domain-containing protein [Flavobacterium araucananum]OXG05060.1 hypothetical protein B0A64_13590 [Flavobacterium araucananum]PWJ96774.1 helix-turn-helix protein [Flavobacterium araucananum]
MEEKIYNTEGKLSRFISYFYVASIGEDQPGQTKFLVPNLEMILILNFGPPLDVCFGGDCKWSHQILNFGIIGPLRKQLNYRMPPGSSFIAANFTLDGFYKIYKVSLDHIKGQEILDPDVISKSDKCAELVKKLVACSHMDQKIELLKSHFIQLMKQTKVSSKFIRSCTQEDTVIIFDAAKIASSKMNTSERNAQLLYKKHLGYSSREKFTHVRFKELIKHLIKIKTSQINWIEIAADFGYYDQSHMIRDFKKFLDITPQYFLSEIDTFCLTQDFISLPKIKKK